MTDDYAILHLKGSKVRGIRFEGGEPREWEGFLTGRTYTSLSRATNTARRKYGDSSINVTKIDICDLTYRIPFAELAKYQIND